MGPNYKPLPWAVDPAAIAPEHLALLRGCVFATPLWESAGAPADIISRTRASTDTAAWETGQDGPRKRGASGKIIRWTIGRRVFVERPFTIYVRLAFTTTANQVVAEINGNSGISIQVESGGLKLNVGASGGHNSVDISGTSNDGATHSVVFVAGLAATDDRVYVDGIDRTASSTASTPSYGSATTLDVLARPGNIAPFTGALDALAIFDTEFTAGQAALLARVPHGLWMPDVPATGGGTTVSGSADAQIGEFTAAGSGKVGAKGSSAASIGDFTAAGSGTVGVTGNASPTIGEFTAAATGAHGVKGSAAADIGEFTASAQGTASEANAVTGQAAAQIGEFTVAASGIHSIAGRAAADVGEFTASGQGAVGVKGQASPSLGEFTASGIVVHGVKGTAAAQVGEFTASGVGISGVIVAFGNVTAREVALANVAIREVALADVTAREQIVA